MLTQFGQENMVCLFRANTCFKQPKDDYTWTSIDGQNWNQIIVFASKDWEAVYS